MDVRCLTYRGREAYQNREQKVSDQPVCPGTAVGYSAVMDTLDDNHFRSLLLAMRDDLTATRETREQGSATVQLDQQSVGRLSRMDALQNQAMAKATDARAKQQLRLIDAALQRLDNGEYGECQECGEPINPKRLEIDPTALYCIECAAAR